jgi:hypothetical protein
MTTGFQSARESAPNSKRPVSRLSSTAKSNWPRQAAHAAKSGIPPERNQNMSAPQAIEAACQCGQRVAIEHDANKDGARRTCRADGKRIFYPDEKDDGWCVFRCKGCGLPIDETCGEAARIPNSRTNGTHATAIAQALPPFNRHNSNL